MSSKKNKRRRVEKSEPTPVLLLHRDHDQSQNIYIHKTFLRKSRNFTAKILHICRECNKSENCWVFFLGFNAVHANLLWKMPSFTQAG